MVIGDEMCGKPAKFAIEPEDWDDEELASVGNIWLCADCYDYWHSDTFPGEAIIWIDEED